MLKIDGHDNAILGVVMGIHRTEVLCYDYDKVIKNLMENDGMDELGAVEFFDFNIAGAYMGEGTPVFLYPFNEEDYNQEEYEL